MVVLPRPVTMMISVQPAATASSTPYWMRGLSTRQSISFGVALVAGKKRVPIPAAGNTALRIFWGVGIRRGFLRLGVGLMVPKYPYGSVAQIVKRVVKKRRT